MWFMCSLRPAGSTPCLLPTPPRGDAVGTVFGAEPSKCTDGTFTRVDVRFAGARNYGKRPQSECATVVRTVPVRLPDRTEDCADHFQVAARLHPNFGRVGRKQRSEAWIANCLCFPPLIKPDGRFSRIRLSEFRSAKSRSPGVS